MVEAMDRSADPCQDFYQFACGGWIRKNPLPDGRSRWSTFNSIWEQNQALLKHLLGKMDRWRWANTKKSHFCPVPLFWFQFVSANTIRLQKSRKEKINLKGLNFTDSLSLSMCETFL